MTPAEQNYDIGDQELLATVSSLQHSRIYCEGAKDLEILSDHKNLQKFTTTKQLSRRQARWSELLGQYKFSIRHIPGTANARADVLSRRPDLVGNDLMDHAILKVKDDGNLTVNVKQINMALTILDDEKEEYPVSHEKLLIPLTRKTM